jgi:hypothetical protein
MANEELLPDSSVNPPPAPAGASRAARVIRLLMLMLLLAWLALMFWNSAKPLPPGTHIASQTFRLSEADVDLAYELAPRPAAAGREMSAIDHAEQLIVVDRSPVTAELMQHLLSRKRLRPNLKIVLVTDPANEAFGGTASQIVVSLEEAGIIVARVRLDRLRDSDPLYSGLWRLLLGWWSDPFDETPGQAGLTAWARMQNFKADRRQLVIADDGYGGWTAVIAPAGAAAGLTLRGSLAAAMITGELKIAAWSADDDRLPGGPPLESRGVGSIDARFLTEGAIETALLDAVAAAVSGDRISIAVENLSDRRLITALLRAAGRGARLQVLLARNPMPNPAVAGELLRDGGGRIEVRWYSVEPGVWSPKLLLVQHRNDLWVNFGSANFTRRNLGDLDLEAGVELRMPARAAPARTAGEYFAKLWSGASLHPELADKSPSAYWRYRIAEAAGLSNF